MPLTGKIPANLWREPRAAAVQRAASHPLETEAARTCQTHCYHLRVRRHAAERSCSSMHRRVAITHFRKSPSSNQCHNRGRAIYIWLWGNYHMRRTPMQTYRVAGSQLSPRRCRCLVYSCSEPLAGSTKTRSYGKRWKKVRFVWKTLPETRTMPSVRKVFVLLENGLQVDFITSLIFEGGWAQV